MVQTLFFRDRVSMIQWRTFIYSSMHFSCHVCFILVFTYLMSLLVHLVSLWALSLIISLRAMSVSKSLFFCDRINAEVIVISGFQSNLNMLLLLLWPSSSSSLPSTDCNSCLFAHKSSKSKFMSILPLQCPLADDACSNFSKQTMVSILANSSTE